MIKYCENYTVYNRFYTKPVKVGNIFIGGNYAFCLQSMTTKDAMDTEASVFECEKMISSGCQLIRISVPSKKEAENLKIIQNELKKKGYDIPLVADIHFTPNAAEIAARIVDKVRINPGNFADKKRFETIIYTDESYRKELKRIAQKLTPFIHICKDNETAVRIGVNHGSLSDRILSRYGDTPLGMVESALEFIRICETEQFYNIVLSMKASNPQVMVQAYRLLVAKMKEEKMNYPLHLGVTEAGDGEDGRIKSAIGIGTLLEDGLGDTIRVSLTEAPEKEIPVAKKIAQRYENKPHEKEKIEKLTFTPNFNPYELKKRTTQQVHKCGGSQVPVVIGDLSEKKTILPSNLFAFGYYYNAKTDKWTIKENAIDYIYIGNNNIDFELPGTLSVIQNLAVWKKNSQTKKDHFPLSEYLDKTIDAPSNLLNFISCYVSDFEAIGLLSSYSNQAIVLILKSKSQKPYLSTRRFIFEMMEHNCNVPIVFNFKYEDTIDEEQFLINASIDNGALFLDGFGDGIFLSAKNIANQMLNRFAFGVLQATRTRIYKTEYISCPSCGRTLFDLEEVTKKIRARTKHLKGLKIAIMGCIVNGPGEMADADYGYVGSGIGKVTLYKEKKVIKKAVSEKDAVEELILLIKANGDWVDPKND